jgi:periplasmic divalent cation tolerance protein
MSEFGTTARIVLTTAASGDEARTLARTLVEERLAACATIIPTVESIYRWEGKVETARETLLLIKTAVGQVDALESRLRALHSYQTPEILVLPVESGSDDYLAWMRDSLLKA